MRSGVLALATICLCAHAAKSNCASEAKTALQARLNSLPLRETLESDRDGEHTRIVLELETLQRFHTVISGAADSLIAGVELLILDGKGWSKEHGKWKPFAAAAATTESTAEDEEALADQLTDGATAICLGTLTKDGRSVVGYELHLDGDPSTGDPYTTMQLYVDPQSRLPVSIDMAGQGEAGPAVTHQAFEYDKAIKFTAPN